MWVSEQVIQDGVWSGSEEFPWGITEAAGLGVKGKWFDFKESVMYFFWIWLSFMSSAATFILMSALPNPFLCTHLTQKRKPNQKPVINLKEVSTCLDGDFKSQTSHNAVTSDHVDKRAMDYKQQPSLSFMWICPSYLPYNHDSYSSQLVNEFTQQVFALRTELVVLAYWLHS